MVIDHTAAAGGRLADHATASAGVQGSALTDRIAAKVSDVFGQADQLVYRSSIALLVVLGVPFYAASYAFLVDRLSSVLDSSGA